MHHIDRNTPWEEVWQAMELLVQQGKVLYVGSSNFAGWHIAQAQELARARHFMGLVSEQSVYNLMKRTVELEVIPACRAYGMAFLPYSPLGGGMLGGKPGDNDRGRRAFFPQSRHDRRIPGVLRNRSTATRATWRSHGSRNNPASPRRSSVRARSRSSKPASRAIETALDEASLARLNELFPGSRWRRTGGLCLVAGRR